MDNNGLFYLARVDVANGSPYYTVSYGNSDYRNFVSKRHLVADIQRGVTHLSAHSYVPLHDTALGSLHFALALQDILGLPNMRAKSAELVEYNNGWRFTIETFSGYTILFNGLSGGYYGEGTRTCHDIMTMFGFDKKQSCYPFEKSSFIARKRK